MYNVYNNFLRANPLRQPAHQPRKSDLAGIYLTFRWTENNNNNRNKNNYTAYYVTHDVRVNMYA